MYSWSFSVACDGLLFTLPIWSQICPQCIFGAFPAVLKAVHLWSNQSGWIRKPGGNRTTSNTPLDWQYPTWAAKGSCQSTGNSENQPCSKWATLHLITTPPAALSLTLQVVSHSLLCAEHTLWPYVTSLRIHSKSLIHLAIKQLTTFSDKSDCPKVNFTFKNYNRSEKKCFIEYVWFTLKQFALIGWSSFLIA